MSFNRSRGLVFGALAAGAAGVVVAVSSGLGAATTGGVAAAQAVEIKTVKQSVRIDGTTVRITKKPSRAVCFAAPHAGACAASLGASELAYATGHSGKRLVIAGVAGTGVKAVIVRLTQKGTVWPTLRNGAFYAVLPAKHRLTSIVKVLAGGRRVSFKA